MCEPSRLSCFRPGIFSDSSLGTSVNWKKLFIAIAAIGGLGFFLNALFKKCEEKKRKKILGCGSQNEKGIEDVTLPLYLEHEYGDLKKTLCTVDPQLAEFFKFLPDHYFGFNDNLLSFIVNLVQHYDLDLKKSLVIGSGTGRLVFELSNLFEEITGIEKSFSKVVTCYQFQNANPIHFDFPLEGSFRTRETKLTYPNCEKLTDNKIKFLNADASITSEPLGLYNFILITKEINDLEDPARLLTNLHLNIVKNGILVIVTDYQWKRVTNKGEGFGRDSVSTSFDLLKHLLCPFFRFLEESDLPDIYGLGLRNSEIRIQHLTAWTKL